ncbi:hypothetical protein BDQ12DRAFT_726174 [Crucibulum laeve]|uniref:Uncharacterized protein n=1 Tax=Crucibulum laeve TaxID=68775 RepID=A0A5C3LQ03_9AGAR|nr:hypothetical protein BDQ12DRAFT_726174 [Crucibulum laeve]
MIIQIMQSLQLSHLSSSSTIESDQTCEMNEAGVMSDAIGSADNGGKFKVINKFGKVSYCVSAKFGYQMLPIFVTPTTVLGAALFEPITTVQTVEMIN